ncbi:elongation factor Ts, partial [Klebsiella pneumoniae]|nr:elongation factor Ts [Klebsiella pneumoniae]
IALADKIVKAVKEAGAADLESAKAAALDGKTVDEAIQELSAKIGEKLVLRRVVKFDCEVATYLHRRSADLPPAVGVLVQYTGSSAEAARGAAMQVAAMKPKYLRREDVPEDIVANERRIAEETAKAEGKPEKALPKIVEGRLNG